VLTLFILSKNNNNTTIVILVLSRNISKFNSEFNKGNDEIGEYINWVYANTKRPNIANRDLMKKINTKEFKYRNILIQKWLLIALKSLI